MGDCETEIAFKSESVELLLDTAKHEYDNEHNRTSVIDSKTSIALPIISAYFLALAQMNDYKFIFSMSISSFIDCLVPTTLFLSYTASLILAMLAVIMMVRVITTRQYNTIKPLDLYDADFLKSDNRVLSFKLITLYIEATEKNKAENNSRIPLYRRGWFFTTISIILFVIYIILKNYT